MKWRLQLKSLYENTSSNKTSNSTGEKIVKSKIDVGNEEDADYDENEKLEGEIKEALYNEKKMDKKYKQKILEENKMNLKIQVLFI